MTLSLRPEQVFKLLFMFYPYEKKLKGEKMIIEQYPKNPIEVLIEIIKGCR